MFTPPPFQPHPGLDCLEGPPPSVAPDGWKEGCAEPAWYVGSVSEVPRTPATTSADEWFGKRGSPIVDEAVKRRRRRLLLYAFELTKNVAAAEDAVQEALARVQSGTRTWDATKSEEEKLKAMCSIVQSVRWDMIANAASRHERVYAAPRSKKEADTAPLALEVLINVQDEAAEQRWVATFQARVQKDAQDKLMADLVELSQKGVYDIDEQVERTGRSKKDVENARQNLRRWVQDSIPKEHADRLKRWRGLDKASKDSEDPSDGGDEQ